MRFTRETGSAVTVRHVEKGAIRIGEETISGNVILFRNEVRHGWQAADGVHPSDTDLAELIAEAPEIIIFGSGWEPAMPPRDLVFSLARKGIGFETMDTPAACRTFNILVSEDRDVAAVLIVD